jgi:hypothetical protein
VAAPLGVAREVAECVQRPRGESAETVEGWSAEAVRWIGAALAKGASARELAADPTFDPFRGRDDFKKLVEAKGKGKDGQ